MSALLNLVEAAAALTQLPVAPRLSSRPSSGSSSTGSTSPIPTSGHQPTMMTQDPSCYPRRISMQTAGSTHAISDDDDTTLASSRIATLRENHLQALRAAAAQAQAQALAPTAQAKGPIPAQVQVASHSGPKEAPQAPKETFPARLHALLADPTVRDVVSWLPHGRAFVVLRPDVFAAAVLPRYFAPEGSNSPNAKTAQAASVPAKKPSKGVHKYPSFTRKLNRWGFRQVSRGPDAGAFTHDLFRRDEPHLCRGMVCQKSRRSKAKVAGQSDDMISVSSASTMSTKSVSTCEKRPYASTVTVSTAGLASQRSVPFKKRKMGGAAPVAHGNGIPCIISHEPQQMRPMRSVPTSTSSVTEGDLTSDNGSVCSAPKPSPAVATQAAEAAAREALARHFHEQHRAFALASLMENSRLAMEAAGMRQEPASARTVRPQAQVAVAQAPVGAMTTHSSLVVALTAAPQVHPKPAAQATSAAEVAKNQLYQAFLQAVSANNAGSR